MSQINITHSIKSEIKDTLSLSMPLVASQLIFACSGFIGTAMVAHLGKDALAASVLVRYAIYVGMGLNFICMSVISIALALFPHLFLRLDMDIHDAVNTILIRDSL